MTSVKYEYNFLAGVMVDNELMFNSYSLKLHLFIKTTSQQDQQMAFNRMDWIMYEIFANSVFVDENDTDAILKLNAADIRVLTVQEPGAIDQVVHCTLVTKLNAICEDTLHIFESELSSAIGHWVKYVYQDTEEHMDNIISSSSKKWWNDSYPRVTPIDETTDITNFKQVTWRELNLHWEEDEDEGELIMTFTSDISNEPQNIISMSDYNDDK